MSPQFFEAWFNTDHKVLGRWLHSFCLEDALILSVAESPFLSEEPKVQYELADLQLAVSVCSRPGKIFLNTRFNRSWWQQLWTISWGMWCRRRCSTEDGLRRECQKFVNYLDDYYSVPEIWHDEENSPRLNAPWILSNVTHLLRNTTLNYHEIWTMPIGQAFWLAATIAEQTNPAVQIADEDEVAGMREMGL